MNNISIALLLFWSGAIAADVTIDGSLGGVAGSSVEGGNGYTYDIVQDLGKLEGENLFHSFETFNIETNETANFSAQSSISNIVARVTGGQSSSILGSVSSTIEGASFWFINPAGVVIGEGASFDFDGAINLSSASYLQFEGGAEFSADNLDSPSGLSFEPAAFGFLGDNGVGTLELDTSTLVLNEGQTFRLFAKQVSMADSSITSEQGSVGIYAAENRDLTISVGGAYSDVGAKGAIVLDDSSIDVSGPIGGSINITGGDVQLDAATLRSISEEDFSAPMQIGEIQVDAEQLTIVNGSDIFAQARAANFVSDIELTASESITLAGTGTLILSNPFLDGSVGGNLTLEAPSIHISDNAFISGEAKQSATGGSITLRGEEIVVTTDAGVSLDRKSNSSGGQLLIQADSLEVSEGGDIVADAFATALGVNFRIEATDMLVSGAATSVTAQTTDNTGQGIDIILDGNLLVENEGLIGTESFGSGTGSNINIQAQNVSLRSGGQIDASALNSGDGGNINIMASKAITLAGAADVRDTEISSKSGDIDREENLAINSGYGEGDGGEINLFADTVRLSGRANISSTAERLSDAFTVVGDAGSINLGAKGNLLSALNVSDGAEITTSAPYSRGGNIGIYVDKFIGISDSTISTFAGSDDIAASGGDIFIDPELLLLNNATINANANGGNGGNIQIIAINIIQDPDTVITASSSQGIDGDIVIDGVTNEVSTLETINIAYSDLSSMLSQRCNVARLSDRSSFVVASDSLNTAAPSGYQSSSAPSSATTSLSGGSKLIDPEGNAMLAACAL